MAQECTESSVAISSRTPPDWWDLHHPISICSWNNNTRPWHQTNPSSISSCEDDVSMSASFTTASNHSGLTVESSRRIVETAASNDLIGEHASDSQLWSHILLSVGNNGDLQENQDVGENLLDALSSKSMSSGIVEQQACDYLKKMDSNWEFTSPSSFSNYEKHLNGFSKSLTESERMDKFSNTVTSWSIAPPDPEVNRQFYPLTGNISLSSPINQYSHHPQIYSDSTSGMGTHRNSGFVSSYDGHDVKVETEHPEVETPGTLFRRSFSSNGVGYPIGLKSSVTGDNSKYYYDMPDATCTNAKNVADVVTLRNRFSKPLIDVQLPKPCFKSSNLSNCRKQGLQISSLTGRGQGMTNEGKKKRSQDTSESVLKKPKNESNTVSSAKLQAPKVKLGDRITALQQIVSPFGKTDTASVLLEAIQYIKFLQEQVQLLSNPYMKTNSHKDPWGSFDRKDKGDRQLDLRSKGLCLVPISCTTQVYHENTGSDYWTPTYRGCLYR